MSEQQHFLQVGLAPKASSLQLVGISSQTRNMFCPMISRKQICPLHTPRFGPGDYPVGHGPETAHDVRMDVCPRFRVWEVGCCTEESSVYVAELSWQLHRGGEGSTERKVRMTALIAGTLCNIGLGSQITTVLLKIWEVSFSKSQ